MDEVHEIKLVKNTAERMEWSCDICGRTVIFENKKMIVAVNGNENVRHTGGTGGLRITGISASQS